MISQNDANIRYKWAQSRVGGGGYITGLLQHPDLPGMLFARCDVAGVLVSRDGGESFEAINHGMSESSHHSVESFATSPHDSNVWFRCSGEARDRRTFGFIHKSTDGGFTWRLVTREPDYIGNGNHRYFGEMIAVDPNDPNNVVAASFSMGLFRSEDLGETWHSVGLKGEPFKAVAFHPDLPGKVYAGTMTEMAHLDYLNPQFSPRKHGGRLYVSEDHGATWSLLYEREDIAFADLAFSRGLMLVAGGETGIWRSTDGGLSFEKASAGLPLPAVCSNIAADPFQPGTFYTGICRWPDQVHIPVIPLYVTRDDGESWHLLRDYDPDNFSQYPFAQGDIRPIGWAIAKLKPDVHVPGRLYMCNWYGVSVSEDGGRTWSGNRFQGIENICIEAIAADPLDPDTFYYAPADKQIEMTRDNGRSYKEFVYIHSAHTYFCSTAIAPSRHRKGLVVYGVSNSHARQSAIYRTEDSGLMAEAVWELPQGCFVQALRDDPFDFSVFYAAVDGKQGGGAGLYRSNDEGLTWQELRSPYPPHVETVPHRRDLVEREILSVVFYQEKNVCGSNQLLYVSPHSRSTFYVGEWTEGIFVTRDGGASWTKISDQLPFLASPSSILVNLNGDDQRPGVLYAGFIREGLWRTEDDGRTWTKLYPLGDGAYNASALAVGGVTPDELYMACEPLAWSPCPSSVLYSPDRGRSWSEIYDESLGAIRWKGIAVNRKTGTVQAVSCGNGAFYAERCI
ncbi:WD40/YVTN/BNR-like repeat-containing protein [Paenibacillus roseipurpureus]|uniref:Sortilin N-terminal domain-containing protein n=1 Tax=Paenibacillus roseopurpureus TaxID=2918901 RepID=A0AA96LWV4_9BACL|nr:hypothetical protein [Paenibacillus sp. MBLB1832]WNR46135.1 hypothetical protein MJB10_08590 [Paenibacillus sp. MBLB1832]